MALTGLRMMPTFPSPSLKFRTVGFPQYGFKDGISDGTFLQYGKVKPAPGIPSSECSLSPSFACALCGGKSGSEPRSSRSCTCHHSRSLRSSTPGVLSSGASYVVSLPLRLYDPIRQSHRHAATSWHSPYTQRLRCAGAPRRPTRPSLLSLLHLSIRAVDLTPAGPLPLLVVLEQRFQASSIFERVATHNARLCQQYPTGSLVFGAASFALWYGPYVCLALLTGYDGMKSYVLHLAF